MCGRTAAENKSFTISACTVETTGNPWILRIAYLCGWQNRVKDIALDSIGHVVCFGGWIADMQRNDADVTHRTKLLQLNQLNQQTRCLKSEL